jgi:hypothetical protein
MLTQEFLIENKDNLQTLAATIDNSDLDLLIDWLKEKDDTLRYTAFLLLQLLSAKGDRVYKYWDNFGNMINDVNSYQRSLGIMLIAENIRWDSQDRFAKLCSSYLEHCDDEKFVTSRQCIQGLQKIIAHTQKHRHEIVDKLLAIQLEGKKETQQWLLLLDIEDVLGILYETEKEARIENYLKSKYELGNDKVKKKIKAILK